MTDNIELTDYVEFHTIVKSILAFFAEGLKLEKNPPQDILEFYAIIVELEKALSLVKSPEEFQTFLVDHADAVAILLEFTQDMANADPEAHEGS